MSHVTNIMNQISSGNRRSSVQLPKLVYDELLGMAAKKLSHERSDHTLQATELVHESYLRLVRPDTGKMWENRRHFFAAAAEAMRRILVDVARRKHSRRHGGSWQRVPLENFESTNMKNFGEVIAVDQALARFEEIDPLKAELVKLRFFAGMSIEEAAHAQGVSVATANRSWRYAKAWLSRELGDDDS